jgi:Uma2 family endonuclease
MGWDMNVAIRRPVMTRAQFFLWAEAQEERYEFDGFGPVAMGGGTNRHSRIVINIVVALANRLRGSGCEPFGPEAGLSTVGEAVRYPDAMITCTKTPKEDRVVPGVIVVFEVVSPTSGYIDRVVKLREYQAVPSIQRYLIAESSAAVITVLERSGADQPWTASALASGDMLRIPEVGIEIPVDELYEGADLS